MLQLFADGARSQSVADDLHITVGTLEDYIRRIRTQVRARRAAGADEDRPLQARRRGRAAARARARMNRAVEERVLRTVGLLFGVAGAVYGLLDPADDPRPAAGRHRRSGPIAALVATVAPADRARHRRAVREHPHDPCARRLRRRRQPARARDRAARVHRAALHRGGSPWALQLTGARHHRRRARPAASARRRRRAAHRRARDLDRW